MIKSDIEKLLALDFDVASLENDKKILKDILIKELINTKENKNFLTTVKSYLKQAGNERPMLQTVMHKHGKQFILDGYTMFVFNNYIEDLEILPQTDEEHTQLDFKQIVDTKNLNDIEFANEDFKVLNNIIKYKCFVKQFKNENVECTKYVQIANKYFDINFLCNVVKILDTNNLTEIKTNDGYTPLYLKDKNEVECIILPVRTPTLNINNAKEEFLKQF